jgi:hypothetical protein
MQQLQGRLPRRQVQPLLLVPQLALQQGVAGW